MKKYILMGGGLLVAFALSASFSLAAGKNGPAGKSDVSFLYLYEKVPSGQWPIVDGGAWGKMQYKPDSFVFNGHGLEAGTNYSLIYYPDPWPGTGLEVLGTGTANNGGNVNIAGDFDFASLCNAKIWLVIAEDAEKDNGMVAWNPEKYLFEYDLVKKADKCLVETVEVPAGKSSNTLSINPLMSGKNYILKARGTACAEENTPSVCTIPFDAEYAQNVNGATKLWVDGVEGYEIYETNLLDLMVNDGFVNWGSYNSSHEYEYGITGNGSNAAFKINDVYYPNNTGNLFVDIYAQL